ncbi:hypothetical protein AQUCO_08700020v1 [Aquilegia coerulea]|uniref:S-locus receptor kinase C-terminal domain-containing protein n=1 Tax=Aquilegia coerulea TaxID=218851 RepID=A0A2G5C6E1_AQUCA|nr:hypothetical protein AQUCO_08700020v1 [Aquilegia coerulea]
MIVKTAGMELVEYKQRNGFYRCIHIGLLCVQEDAADRPTMSHVLSTLETESIELPIPTQPAFSVGKIPIRASHSTSSSLCSVNGITLSGVSAR